MPVSFARLYMKTHYETTYHCPYTILFGSNMYKAGNLAARRTILFDCGNSY